MARGRGPTAVTETEARRERVAGLHLEGRSMSAIARELKVAVSTVSRDLDAIRAEWLESALCDFNARKAEELANIRHIWAEAWAAWRRSQKPADTVTRKEQPGPDPDAPEPEDGEPAPPPVMRVVEELRRTEHRDGAAEFLRVLQWCVEQRCKILGLDAPKQIQMVGAVAVKVEAAPPPGVSADELAFLADLADRCGVLGPAPAADPRAVPGDGPAAP
jgi:hypothetical protein